MASAMMRLAMSSFCFCSMADSYEDSFPAAFKRDSDNIWRAQ